MEEIIYTGRNLLIICYINSINKRNLYFKTIRPYRCKCFLCRYDKASPFILRYCHVTPPVHRNNLIAVINNSHSAVQIRTSLLQPEIHLPDNSPDSLIFIHTKYRITFICLRLCYIKRLRRQWIMADNSKIPLDTSGKPCISNSKVAKSEHIIRIKKILSCFLIPQLPQSSTIFRKKYCLQILVFQNRRLYIFLMQLSCISIKLTIWKRTIYFAISFINLIILVQIKHKRILSCQFPKKIRYRRLLPQFCNFHTLRLKY